MMLIAQQGKKLVFADEIAGNPTDLRCPGCQQEVIFRHGRKNVAHFAHRHADLCGFSEGETAEHLRGKKQLYRLTKQKGWRPRLEVYLPQIAQRPDILLEVAGKRMALEFQCSPLSLQRLRERNEGYRQEGITVWWLLGSPYQRKLGKQKICQFTQLINGQPFLLFWNVKRRRLERKMFAACSYSKNQFNKRQILSQQIQQLTRQPFCHPSVTVKKLAVTVAQNHYRLVQCPFVCHDLVPTWPALAQPVILWRIQVVVRLADYSLFTCWTPREWVKLLLECGDGQWLTGGCVHTSFFQQQLIAQFTADLLTAGILAKSLQQFILVQRPQWVAQPLDKINILANQQST